MNLITVCDATHANIMHLPAGHAAGYVTGTPDIAWTASDWDAHPGAIRIDQSPADTARDETADVLDYENGAATLADIPGWARAAWTNRSKGVRQGQRWPCVYASMSNVTPVANTLTAAKITSGVFLWIADWGIADAAAQADILKASGPWPVVGVQLRDAGLYDVSLFSSAWLGNVTGAKPAAKPAGITKTTAESALATLTAYVAES